jgi:hypothetical protein
MASNRDALQDWLEAQAGATGDRVPNARLCALQVAHRAGMRVLPIALHELLLAQPLRSNQAIFLLQRTLTSALAAAKRFGDVSAGELRGAVEAIEPGALVDTASVSSAAKVLLKAISIPSDAAISDVQGSAASTADAVDATAEFLSTRLGGAAAQTAWEAVLQDCRAREEGRLLAAAPLWPEENPLEGAWSDLRETLRSRTGDWSFWLDWYERALAGTPQKWDIIRQLALIPPDDWQTGADHVNRIIAKLQLKQAVAKTPNAEVISVNEATLKLRADPLSEMPRDHLDEAVQKLRDVASLFDLSANRSNQHRALEPERELIEKATQRHAQHPRMLHWYCIRAIRRMDVKIRNGDCPSQDQDADIADFYETVLSVSVDLYERDPLVREAVDHAAGAHLRDLTQDEADTIVRAADEVAERSEDDLATELPEQARAAVDPTTPLAERKEALYVTKSRLLRSYLILVWRGTKASLEEIEKVSDTVAGICKNAVIIAGAVATVKITIPIWLKPAIDIILRMF